MLRQQESESEEPPSDSEIGPWRVMRLLRRGPLPVSELLRLSRLDVKRFTAILDNLERVGVVELRDEHGVQVASRTRRLEEST